MTWTYKTFKKLGVPGPEPKFIAGTMGILMEKVGFDIKEVYETSPEIIVTFSCPLFYLDLMEFLVCNTVNVAL